MSAEDSRRRKPQIPHVLIAKVGIDPQERKDNDGETGATEDETRQDLELQRTCDSLLNFDARL